MTHADYLKKRDEILSRLALDAHNSQWIGDETVAKAQAAIDALVNEVGVSFLNSVGEDDKIDTWKKYMNNGDQS
jgi:hypothetical protein